MRIIPALGLAAALTLPGSISPVLAQPRPALLAPVDYNSPDAWLCLPGRADACSVDLSALVVSGNGRTRLEEVRLASRQPPIDCFYVYPTVSRDAGLLSDMSPGPEERQAVASQFARFSQVCRQFAPVYRQITLTALRQAMSSDEGLAGLRANAPVDGAGGGYNDVRAAFRSYMANYNQGRGFVLIGHSQGASHLTRLIGEEIEGTPLADYLVSAVLLGTNIEVPAGGGLVGGTFRYTPLCQRNNQTGCVITYSSFRDTIPPAPGSMFGQASRPGMVAGCTNPANLRTGRGEPDAYFAALGDYNGASGRAPNWTGDPWAPVGTPFVKVPGLIETACVVNARGAYLSVLVKANPRDARTDEINGDVLAAGQPDPAWGLHLIDMHLSMGDLIGMVGSQGRSWRAPRR